MRIEHMSHANQHHCASVPLLQHISEQQILELEDVFLSSGPKRLTVATPRAGRELVSAMIASLHCFGRIACLTALGGNLPQYVSPILDEMALSGSFCFSHGDIDHFLLNYFYYDFVWIECSSELSSLPWFGYFEKKLFEFNLCSTGSVLFICYVGADQNL